jgi:hypothetical protein
VKKSDRHKPRLVKYYLISARAQRVMGYQYRIE